MPVAARAAAGHEAPLPCVATVAEAPLEVAVVARDVGIVVAAGIVRRCLGILPDPAPDAQARPPVRAMIGLELGEELVPAARILAGLAVRMVLETELGGAQRPAERQLVGGLQLEVDLGRVVVLPEGPGLFRVVGLPPGFAGVREEEGGYAGIGRDRDRQLETVLEEHLVLLHVPIALPEAAAPC